MLEGTKYDNGKPRIAEMVVDFKIPLEELCKVWEFGADKYEKSNWKKLDNGVCRYTNAMLRHLLAEEDSLTDSESGLLHASHIAFNALARLYFLKKYLEPVNYEPGSIVEVGVDHTDFKPIFKDYKDIVTSEFK